jgi:hypothetical protein
MQSRTESAIQCRVDTDLREDNQQPGRAHDLSNLHRQETEAAGAARRCRPERKRNFVAKLGSDQQHVEEHREGWLALAKEPQYGSLLRLGRAFPACACQ